MTLELLPAVDVADGQAVRLVQGEAGSETRYGDPLEAVGPEKARRVRQAAEAWLAGRPELAGLDVRLEAFGVHGRRIRRAPFD